MSDVKFVLGIDLDGVVADFYGCLRPIAAEWLGVPVETLTENVKYGLKEWGLKNSDQYLDLHRFAVTQRRLFEVVKPLEGAAPALRRLDATKYVRIRIITHRLYAKYLHQIAARQTTEWLDNYGIPYWDLCFMKEKDKVGASLYIEDSPENIRDLKKAGKSVIIFTNSTNIDEPGPRANSWVEVEELVLEELEKWKRKKISEGKFAADGLVPLSTA
jgi:5'(3')-deoxyribonucleotidase